jgi:suppressor for copper-sensitivity B
MKQNRNILLIAAAFAAVFGLFPVAAAAQSSASAWVRTDQTQVRLVAATTATGTAGSVRLGLHFRLEPGWKIYWRSPGDAGFPPKPEWTGSRNLAAAEFRWPAPERFELFGLDTFGYSDELVLPITARLERSGAPLALKLGLDYLVCEKVCIPYQAALTLDLPAGAATPSEHAHLIDRFVARVPGDGAGSGLNIERAAWRGGGSPIIEVTARALTAFQSPDLIVETPPDIDASFGRPAMSLSDQGRTARLRIPIRAEDAAKARSLAGTPVTLTLVDGERSMERTVTLDTGLPTPTTQPIDLLAALLIALLGGLILNLMPCVLPVLSLKLMSFVGQGGGAATRVRRNFLATAAGIVASFGGLAAALIAAKAAGATVGWGIQFQQPLFLIAMALLVALFAANLWGWFEIRLPQAIGEVAASGGPLHQDSARGAFFTGVLATLLATPCSAPFVGTAVGFALAQGPLPIVAIFLTMGLGLALPYLVIAAFPGAAVWLPRPGRWMMVLRIILGVALIGTAVWLLSIVAVQTGRSGAFAVAACVAALLAVLWSLRQATGVRLVGGRVALAVLVVLAFLVPGRFKAVPAPDATVVASDAWRVFDQAAIETLVREGRVVFVDVTADWCITCQVNKAAVLARGDVAARLADGSVVPMRADWTRPNEEISHYLASFGRYGIPFNVVYGPAAADGIALPEILTREAVLNAFEKARAPMTSDAHPAKAAGGGS